MSSIGSSNTMGIGHIDPQNLVGHLDEVKSAAAESIQKALTMMQQSIAGNFTLPNGAPTLDAPARNVNDMTLRIGLLQDALNQLQQQVSKLEIQGRMSEMQETNRAQLEKIEKQMQEAQEAYKKNQEAQKKSNIFEAIGNWFKAAFDFVCAIFTAITAVAYIIVNPVAAAGLFVAAASLFASGVLNTVMAIDSTVKAAGGESFLSDKVKQDMQLASQILGYVALGATVISGVGVAICAARTLGMTAMKEAISVAGKEAVKAIAGYFKEALRPLMEMGVRQGLAAALLKGTGEITTGVGNLKVQDIREDAALHQKSAEEAEAQAKALEGLVKMLRQMIEQLQQQMEDMIDSCMDSVSAIFNALDESQQTMKGLFQAQTA